MAAAFTTPWRCDHHLCGERQNGLPVGREDSAVAAANPTNGADENVRGPRHIREQRPTTDQCLQVRAGRGRATYTSFAVPDRPQLATLIAAAADRAGPLWTAHRGLR